MKQNKILISDFDGTISKADFFWYVVDKLLNKQKDLQPWDDYLAGKITHFEALAGIFSKIKLTEKEFKEFVLNIPIEDGFVQTALFCNKNNIPFYILSAGTSYYINIILQHLNLQDKITVISNPAVYDTQKGLTLNKPSADLYYYSNEFGINKRKVVEQLKHKGFTVFAGDGRPDIEPAKVADKVFARSELLKLCHANAISYTELKCYTQILEYLQHE